MISYLNQKPLKAAIKNEEGKMITEQERSAIQRRMARRPEDAAYDILKSGHGWQSVSGGGFRCCAVGSNILIGKNDGKIKVSIKKVGQDNNVFMQMFPDDSSNKFSLFYRNLLDKEERAKEKEKE